MRSLEIHLRKHLHFHGVLTNSSFKLQEGYSIRMYTIKQMENKQGVENYSLDMLPLIKEFVNRDVKSYAVS